MNVGPDMIWRFIYDFFQCSLGCIFYVLFSDFQPIPKLFSMIFFTNIFDFIDFFALIILLPILKALHRLNISKNSTKFQLLGKFIVFFDFRLKLDHIAISI